MSLCSGNVCCHCLACQLLITKPIPSFGETNAPNLSSWVQEGLTAYWPGQDSTYITVIGSGGSTWPKVGQSASECCGLNVCVPLKFICWNPNPQRWWNKQVRPLGGAWVMRVEPSWMGLVFLQNRSLALSTMWGHSKKIPSMNQEVGPYQIPYQICRHHDLRLQPPELWEINFCCL